MAQAGDMGLKRCGLKPRRMDSSNKDCMKGKRKLKHFLGSSEISVVSESGIPEFGKQNLEEIVSRQCSDGSCVTYSGKVTEVVSDDSINDGLPSPIHGSGIASQNEAVEDILDSAEESDLICFRRATATLFFNGEYNCRHVVPIGSRFQAEIPPLESKCIEKTQSEGIRWRNSENHIKSRCRVNKVATFPNSRRSRLSQQGRII